MNIKQANDNRIIKSYTYIDFVNAYVAASRNPSFIGGKNLENFMAAQKARESDIQGRPLEKNELCFITIADDRNPGTYISAGTLQSSKEQLTSKVITTKTEDKFISEMYALLNSLLLIPIGKHRALNIYTSSRDIYSYFGNCAVNHRMHGFVPHKKNPEVFALAKLIDDLLYANRVNWYFVSEKHELFEDSIAAILDKANGKIVEQIEYSIVLKKIVGIKAEKLEVVRREELKLKKQIDKAARSQERKRVEANRKIKASKEKAKQEKDAKRKANLHNFRNYKSKTT